MRRAMEHLSGQGVRTIRLEANPPGVRLYRSLGFVDEFESLRFRLEKATADRKRAHPRPSGVRSWGRVELPLVGAFDAEHFGDDRTSWLSVVLGSARAAYWVQTQQGVRGYAMVVPSALGVRIGPWLALDPETAADLLAATLADFSDSAIVLGVPSVNPAVVTMLESHGMTPTPSSLRMIYGPSGSSGTPEAIYAIGNGAMG